jgi:hypothetical protein
MSLTPTDLETASIITSTTSTTETATRNVLSGPTSSPVPTSTPVPTATPLPEPVQKPFLAVPVDEHTLILYDSQGGKKVITMPDGGWFSYGWRTPLAQLISPDGEWLVYFTGNIIQNLGPVDLPIWLNLYHIPTGETRHVVQVVTEGYIERNKQADNLNRDAYSKRYPGSDVDEVRASNLNVFYGSIGAAAWAPDGLSLAFSAMIDGLSTDVYLYDLETGKIRQVESSLENVSDIEWAPDGKRIVVYNALPIRSYWEVTTVHVVTPGDKPVQNPLELYGDPWLSDPIWLTDDTVLVTRGSDTGGNNLLWKINVNNGHTNLIWDDTVLGYGVDLDNKVVLVNSGEFSTADRPGLYYVGFNGQKQKVFDGIYALSVYFRGGKSHRFLVRGINLTDGGYEMAGVVALDLEGNPTPLGWFDDDTISVSPDHNWLSMGDEDSLHLFDADDHEVKSIPAEDVSSVIWLPDSSGAFYHTYNDLYYIDLPVGEPKLIDQIHFYDSAWIP